MFCCRRCFHRKYVVWGGGGLQRDVVYLGWPIAPSYMSPNAGVGGSCGVSANEYSSTNKLWRSIFNLWYCGLVSLWLAKGLPYPLYLVLLTKVLTLFLYFLHKKVKIIFIIRKTCILVYSERSKQNMHVSWHTSLTIKKFNQNTRWKTRLRLGLRFLVPSSC